MATDSRKNKLNILYAWRYDSDANELNLAAPKYSLLELEAEINNLQVGDQLFLKTTKIPKGSPHHTDNLNEVCNDKRLEFESVQILITEEKIQEITFSIDKDNLILEMPIYIKQYFLESLTYSLEFAYYYDNFVPLLTLSDYGEIVNGRLYFWATDGNHIVYN